MLSRLVVSDSLLSYGLEPARLFCPRDSPDKNTGVGCPDLLPGIELASLTSPALAGGYFTTSTTWEALKVKVKLLSRVQLFAAPWTVAHQAPLSMGFSRQEYWSGLSFPSPGDLPYPRIKPRSPALQADTLTSEPPGKPLGSPNLPQFRTELVFSTFLSGAWG